MPGQIILDKVSKRFRRDWIFKDISYTFETGSRTAILGINGSGKSTLIKVISGYVGISEGKVDWRVSGKSLELKQWHKHFSICAPYLELIEEFTLAEILDFHFQLKPLRADIDLDTMLSESGLAAHKSKTISLFSSGMKQRLRIILALASDTDIYLLDEPCSNLDDQGVLWYKSVIKRLPNDKSILVGSNIPHEYEFCNDFIKLEDYKTVTS